METIAETAVQATQIVAGRGCGDCAFCCKLLLVRTLNKPPGKWCEFCSTKQGCDIWPTRPNECRDYYCEYLKQDWIGEEWYPLKSRMIIALMNKGEKLVINVDPQRPDAWRKEPYYSTIKRWAAGAANTGRNVVIQIGQHFHVIFPNHDQDMGMVAEDECLIFGITQTAAGPMHEARKIKAADEHLYRTPVAEQ
jgi:hypothetical protein